MYLALGELVLDLEITNRDCFEPLRHVPELATLMGGAVQQLEAAAGDEEKESEARLLRKDG